MRDRDNALKESMDSRDNNCMNNLGHCKQSFRMMSYEVKNNKTILESLAMRQRELTESNAKILNRAMETVSNKKKMPLPQIRISYYKPYIVVLQGVTDPPIPYTNPDSIGAGPSAPCTESRKNENHSAIGKKELTQ